MPDINDQVQKKLEAVMKEVAQMIDSMTPEGYGFCVMMFNMGEGGFMNYMSNANRQDVTRVLEEMVKNLKGGN